jgi:outer membrane protein
MEVTTHLRVSVGCLWPMLIGMLFVVWKPVCHAQVVKGTMYRLDECIAEALNNSFDLQQNNAQTRAARAQLLQAFGQYLPQADINAGYNRQLTNLAEQISFVNGVPLIGQPRPNTYSMNGAVSWTIFNGFSREADYDAARATVDATLTDTKFNRQTIAFNVQRQFYEVLRLQNVVNSRYDNVVLARSTLARLQSMQKAGRAPVTQILSQEAEIANQDVSLLQAENDVSLAKARLLALMCLDPTDDIALDETTVPGKLDSMSVFAFSRLISNQDALVEQAVQRRGDVLSARFRTSAAQHRIQSAKGGYLPTVVAQGGYVWRNTEIASLDRQGQMFAGLQFRVPLFDQFQTHVQIENAQLQHTQRGLDEQRLQQDIRTNVRTALVQLRLAEQSLYVTKRAYESASVSYTATQERFAVGAANLLEVQTANNQRITAQINQITAAYRYLDARTVVEYVAGMFPEY